MIDPVTLGGLDYWSESYSKPIQSGARWLGLNLLAELDGEGEYYLDRTKGDLYVIPAGGASATTAADLDLVVSVAETVMNVTASNVHFEGLNFIYSQGNGVEVNGDNIAFVGCTVSNVGAVGLTVTGIGTRVEGCHIHSSGCAAMSIQAGTRATLTAGNASVMGNTLHDFSLWKRMYQPGVHFDAVGSRFTNNTIHDGPHAGMIGRANDCVFSNNNFTRLCTESGDAGAFYTGRSWADRGNSIVGNTFAHIRNTGAPIPLQAQNVHAIHFGEC